MNIDVSLAPLLAIGLATVRTIGLLMTGPLFGHASVPIRVRAGIGLVIAIVIAPVVPTAQALETSVPAMITAVAAEALVGVTMGFALQLIFMTFAPLGELISTQGGLGSANVLDSASGSSTVVLGVLLQSFAIVVFLAIGGHHEVLRGLAASFERIPVGTASLSRDFLASAANLGGALFEVTARLAAPVTTVMLVANVGIGILGRAIPQLNLMALQLPANVAVILLILGLAAGPFSDVVANTLTGFTDRAFGMLLGAG